MSINGKPIADDADEIAKRLKAINPDWQPFRDPTAPRAPSPKTGGTSAPATQTSASGITPEYVIDLYRRARSAVCSSTGYSKKIGGYIRDPALKQEFEKFFENNW